MELFDTHCHLDVADFDRDRSEVLARARAVGVDRLIVPAIDAARWDGLLGLCDREAGLYPALGLHPMFYRQHSPLDDIERLESILAERRPVAIGEIGLDFFLSRGAGERLQYDLFERQLIVARDVGLPIILHVRKGHEEVLKRLNKVPVAGGIAHAFNGSLELARRYIDLGFKLGFGGMVTYEKSTKLRQLVKQLPLESIVLESDAPDMSPSAHHGERNSPEYLPEIAQVIAELRDLSVAKVARVTTDSAKALFNL